MLIPELRLRPLRPEDEAAYRAATAELALEAFSFGFVDLERPFAEQLARAEAMRRGDDVGDFVESTYLVAEVGTEIVGRASIRHALNAQLAAHGGHIGYAVRPAFRRRGYAQEILKQSLVIVRSYGVDDVLVTCDDSNLGSAAVIERCGGMLERVVPAHESETGLAFRRYWIR